MASIEVLRSGVVFHNPLPLLRSRHGYFPSLAQLENGELLAAVAVGQAFESVDLTTMLGRSSDQGSTWSWQGPLLDKSVANPPVSDFLKLTHLGNGSLLAFGYGFPRPDRELPLANPQTGGLLDSRLFLVESLDSGQHWNPRPEVPTSFREPVEASAPLSVLSNGAWAAPIANFKKWDGTCETGFHGRLLVTHDQGKSWHDNAITMEFPKRRVTIWEQRLAELEDGRLVIIAWNYDVEKDRALPNHYVISEDGGTTFTPPCPTGICGQTASVAHLGHNRLLALHCLRDGTDRPGIYACLVDLNQNRWDIQAMERIWSAGQALRPDESVSKEFAFLKFGQPSAIALADGSHLVVHWQIDQGQGTIAWTRIRVTV